MRPVLVTRAEPGASRTCERLVQRGHVPINAATANISFRDAALDLQPGEALALTSPNGAEAAARLTSKRDQTVFAVGEATASAARQAGFTNVMSAGGDGAALAAMIATQAAGPLVHVRGRDQGFDLTAALAEAGLQARPVIAYSAETVDQLPPEALDAMGEGPAVLVHSIKGAQRFEALLRGAGCESLLKHSRCAAISEAAARTLIAAGAGSVEIAQTPDEPALFDALARALR